MSLHSYWHHTTTAAYAREAQANGSWNAYDRNLIHWTPTRIFKGGQTIDTRGWVACKMYLQFPETRFLDGVSDKPGHDVTCSECIQAVRYKGRIFATVVK